MRLSVDDFGNNWNPYNVDGNNAQLTEVRNALLPTFFNYDTKGNATPNPNFVESAEQTNARPDDGALQAESQGGLGRRLAVDGDDMIATWKANNGSQKDFNIASHPGLRPDRQDRHRRRQVRRHRDLQGAYPDWTQPFASPAWPRPRASRTPRPTTTVGRP